ncbi:hypothetical protein QBC43DRAFT_339420 [Cladorrhinum sp. PSN259]|nr:hypothetical protein QBC43DRAFT_339420 [Cladorrhinum sp. PSN259]
MLVKFFALPTLMFSRPTARAAHRRKPMSDGLWAFTRPGRNWLQLDNHSTLLVLFNLTHASFEQPRNSQVYALGPLAGWIMMQWEKENQSMLGTYHRKPTT